MERLAKKTIEGSSRLSVCKAVRAMSKACNVSKAQADAEKIISASISSVSSPELVSKQLSFDSTSNVLTIADNNYQINNNVKVVAFGKAVLGMVAAVERILGNHITEGVVSVPIGAVKAARRFYPHHIPRVNKMIRICEGAAGNLPDSASEAAAKEILSLARSCGEGDILLALISGGGSALLSCPVPEVTVGEKRKVIESLSRKGADIHEMNTVRKAISQTKGGKLAEAAFPAKVLALILSDVIGDHLEVIASGPTVPHNLSTERSTALKVLKKYGLQDPDIHSSVDEYLRSQHRGTETARIQAPLNVIVGSNIMATAAAQETAIGLGYDCYVWTHQLQGEAAFLGGIYALLAQYILLKQSSNEDELKEIEEMLHKYMNQLCSEHSQLQDDVHNLMQVIEMVERGPFCLIGAGEPTVKVTGNGRGGRNQELVLAYALKLSKMRSHNSDSVFLSFGTDGQDGDCDAAGAMVDTPSLASMQEQGLQPEKSLADNDSNTFFSLFNSGRNLIKTGLTGTNVMDIHVLLLK